MTATHLKLVIAGIGIALFGVGVRLGLPHLRWTGIACVGAAFLLRFWRPERRRDAERT